MSNKPRHTRPTSAPVAQAVQTTAPAPQKKIRSIVVPPGIGDNIWLFQKLLSQKEKFHFIMPNGQPQRGHQIFDLVPQVTASYEYRPGLNYSTIEENNRGILGTHFSLMTDDLFFLSANEHLERGYRIETFLPDLETNYLIDYQTSEVDSHLAEHTLDPYEGKKLIGIYTSSYSNARNWDGWTYWEWIAFIGRVEEMAPGKFCYVVIGAEYDTRTPQDLIQTMTERGISCCNTIGQPLSVVVELLKRMDYFIGFPSGLSILNETLGKDGLMMYPRHLENMINAWAERSRITNHNYKGMIFPHPEELFIWLRDVYQLFNRP